MFCTSKHFGTHRSVRNWLITAFSMILISSAFAFAASSEQVIYSFTGASGASDPIAGVIFDAAGNIYGTTFGRSMGCGDVYELSPGASGWTEKVLYRFKCGNDGGHPTAGVIFDAQGNLYGTASSAGAHNSGVVFELIPQSGGTWKEKMLHAFTGNDGKEPNDVIFDGAGNLFGTTRTGTTFGKGSVFELTKQSNGTWKEITLRKFHGKDGDTPYGTVVFDTTGNLYGTTSVGGTHAKGTVYQLSPASNGTWTEKVLHNFSGSDGTGPVATPVFDTVGNLYVTTLGGGASGWGTVAMLTPGASWTEQVLYSFTGGSDGGTPESSLVFDASGNLYGTTYTNSSGTGFGTAFELTNSHSGWSESVLHTFTFSPDGGHPVAGMVFDAAGNLFGTTTVGGATRFHLGTVFMVTP